MTRSGRLFALLCIAWSASCARGCGCGDARLAELVEVHGASVERDYADAPGEWKDAQLGDGFALGDGARAGEKAQAVLQLIGGASIRLRPSTQIRFLPAGADGAGHGIDVEMGEAEISAGGSELSVRTPEGQALIAAGSRVSLRRTAPARVVYRVELGTARLVSDQGQERAIERGQELEIGIGLAVLEPTPAPAAVAPEAAKGPSAGAPVPVAPVPAPALPAVKPESAAAAVGADQAPASDLLAGGPPASDTAPATIVPAGARADSVPEGPARGSVAAPAGESFTVHAARLPVVVTFEVGARCPGEAVLAIGGKPRARGRGRVGVSLTGGRHPYRLHCVRDGAIEKESAASGAVSAVRDAGLASLPRRAPSSFVDADGKRYTVMYQNLLPKITFSWPDAPAAKSYTLHVESHGKPSLYSTKKPEQVFAQGALRDGKHALYFTTPDGARSKTTTLEIVFDNAAPKASLSAPADGSFAPGAEVRVAGVALPGWRVTLPGGRVDVDGQARFSGTAVPTAEQPDIALRIESPRGDVHYYVRRAKGP